MKYLITTICKATKMKTFPDVRIYFRFQFNIRLNILRISEAEIMVNHKLIVLCLIIFMSPRHH